MRSLHIFLVDHRVAKRRVFLAVTKQDLHLLYRHALIYRLCSERSPELMGMHVFDTGILA